MVHNETFLLDNLSDYILSHQDEEIINSKDLKQLVELESILQAVSQPRFRKLYYFRGLS